MMCGWCVKLYDGYWSYEFLWIFFGDKLSSRSVPCHNLTLKVPDLHGELVCLLNAPCLSFHELLRLQEMVALVLPDSAPDSQTPSQTLQAYHFSLECYLPQQKSVLKKLEDGKCNPSVQGPPDSRLANLPKSLGSSDSRSSDTPWTR